MIEHPILFSGGMVRAILEGRKTQTRRVAKLNAAGRVQLKGKQWHPEDAEAVQACPYGVAGDRLWVREMFASTAQAGEGSPWWVYRATDADWETMEGWRWSPCIHMKRVASRLSLAVSQVRLERLQAITEADAVAEGVEPSYSTGYYDVICEGGTGFSVVEGFVGGVPKVGQRDSQGRLITHVQHVPARLLESARDNFRLLWIVLQGAESWEANPLVWAITFPEWGGGQR